MYEEMNVYEYTNGVEGIMMGERKAYTNNTTNKTRGIRHPTIVGPKTVRPGTNRLVDERLTKQKHKLHLKKLKNVKSTIDTKPPASLKYRKTGKSVNLKREYQKKMRNAEIQKQNNLLIRKILDLDCRDEKVRASTYRSAPPKKHVAKGLNDYVKKQELKRITSENQRILKRIISVNSDFNSSTWKKSNQQREKILHNMQQNSKNYCGRATSATKREYYGSNRQVMTARPGFNRVDSMHDVPQQRRRPHSSSVTGYRNKSALNGNGSNSRIGRPLSAKPGRNLKFPGVDNNSNNNNNNHHLEKARDMERYHEELAGLGVADDNHDNAAHRLTFEEETDRLKIERNHNANDKYF